MILARFTCPKAGQDIKLWCKECPQCQQKKISKPETSQINDGIKRFSHIHLDNVGPLSAAPDSPHWYLVNFTDRMTKWVEAEPVSSPTVVFVVFQIWHAFIHNHRQRFSFRG